jgi:hypothetical protein
VVVAAVDFGVFIAVIYGFVAILASINFLAGVGHLTALL